VYRNVALAHACVREHAGPAVLFAALAVGWTWPLVLHLRDAVPGGPGDNYSFLWNLWWMRHVLATPRLSYFHTTYLFYPFGTPITNHPHTALPALVAATLLAPVSIVTAQNLLLLAYLFGNMAIMYALVWDLTRHTRAAVLAGVLFGISPYLASHLLGHFDLIAVWPLPAFALLVRRAVQGGSKRSAIGAGVVLAATAYIAYYYVVYLCFFLAVYLLAWLDAVGVRWSSRMQMPLTRRFRRGLMAAAVLFATIALWIVITGGTAVRLGRFVVSAYTPQNVLTAMWICVLGSVLCTWRPAIVHRGIAGEQVRRAAGVAAWVAAMFAVGAAPLLWQAARLVGRGEYVTQAYQWRSAPRGVDLIAPLLGPPFHPLLQAVGFDAYTFTHLNRIEGIGWIGIVPALLFFRARVWNAHVSPDLRIWRTVAAAFAVWALGPFLTVADFDTGLKLPVILLRYVPFVANARMPGRAMIGVFMALAVISGVAFSAAQGWLRRPAFQWLLIGLLAFEFWDAPIPLTLLDRPAAYQELAAEPPGGVCEVPFGIGDGLSGGLGSQERRVLYYATVHEHPLVGGYIGRMPADAAQRYEDMPVVGALLRLSDGRPDSSGPTDARRSSCRYVVVNRPRMSAGLRAYVQQLPLELVAADEERDIYRVR
jgi:hypothetical protein